MEDIDECAEHTNICKNGHCTNTFGSFMCSCNEGFRLDDSGVVCIDVNECFENPYICRIGECVNEEGRYYCQCPEGYMPLPGRSKQSSILFGSGFNVPFVFVEECVDMRKDLCFLNYDRGECTTPMTESQSKKVCCCSMGQAWGPCEPCPSHGTSRYTLVVDVTPFDRKTLNITALMNDVSFTI